MYGRRRHASVGAAQRRPRHGRPPATRSYPPSHRSIQSNIDRGTLRRRAKRAAKPQRAPIVAAGLAACGFLSLVIAGGVALKEPIPLLRQFDRLAAKLGFGLTHIALSGHNMTSDAKVFAALGLDQSQSLLTFDSSAAGRRIRRLPWVKDVRIQRTFPHRLDITIEERVRFAVWQTDGREFLIDNGGHRLGEIAPGRVRTLPFVAGPGAPVKARAIVDAIARWPDLVVNVVRSERVDGRRWTLHLADNRRVLLPEAGVAAALARLMRGRRGQRLFDRAFAVADFRVGNQLRLRLAPARSARGAAARLRQARG